MMQSNVIVGIAISRGSSVFSQFRVKVPASLTNVGSLAVGSFHLVNCSLSILGFVPVFKCRNIVVGLFGYTDVLRL